MAIKAQVFNSQRSSVGLLYSKQTKYCLEKGYIAVVRVKQNLQQQQCSFFGGTESGLTLLRNVVSIAIPQLTVLIWYESTSNLSLSLSPSLCLSVSLSSSLSHWHTLFLFLSVGMSKRSYVEAVLKGIRQRGLEDIQVRWALYAKTASCAKAFTAFSQSMHWISTCKVQVHVSKYNTNNYAPKYVTIDNKWGLQKQDGDRVVKDISQIKPEWTLLLVDSSSLIFLFFFMECCKSWFFLFLSIMLTTLTVYRRLLAWQQLLCLGGGGYSIKYHCVCTTVHIFLAILKVDFSGVLAAVSFCITNTMEPFYN